jgi:hypothetical protein
MFKSLQQRNYGHWLLANALPWLGFTLVLLWGWRIYDLFNRIPAYGDALEVVWGIQQYHDALVNSHTLPLFTPLVFAPNGWHTATLAHTPFLFLFAQPFYIVGGVAFAYNALTLLSFGVAFAGSMKLMRQFVTSIPATAAALVFTFMNARWFRILGHLHILWAISLLPWLLVVLVELMRGEPDKKQSRKLLISGGLIWGLMVNFSYYSIFLGAIAFAIWGRHLFSARRLKQAIAIAFVAAILSAPTLILYQIGSRQDKSQAWSIRDVEIWGVSPNSLFDVASAYPIPALRQLSKVIYSGPADESSTNRLGLITGLLTLLGVILTWRKRRERSGLLWLTGVAFVLSLGILLRWNGQELISPIFQPLDTLLWCLGRALKPDIFTSAMPQPPFDNGIPLPGFLLTAVVPFYESARVMSRYALVMGLGLITIAAIGLDRMPAMARWLLAVVWVVEGLPSPTGPGVPITTLKPHPAFEWLARQPMAEGENIVDITYPTVMVGGEIVYATQYHHQSTVSGVGSYPPEHIRPLWGYLINESLLRDGYAMGGQKIVNILGQYNVRYVLFHIKDDKSEAMWNSAQQNPYMRAVKCFDPNPGPSPWGYPICIAEVSPQQINVLTTNGWSQMESWGIWAEGQTSQADWTSTAQADYQLSIEAFPYCPAQKAVTDQELRLQVNDVLLLTHTWTRCEVWRETVTIPKASVKEGQNHLDFYYAYATRPSESEPGNGDTRQLSVGFTRLNIQRK